MQQYAFQPPAYETNFAPPLLLSIVPVTHGAPAFDRETHAMKLAKHFLQSDEILLTRSDLLSALFAMGFANGVSKNVFEAIQLNGFSTALGLTFGISVLIWLCAILAFVVLHKSDERSLLPGDAEVAAILVGMFFIPISYVSWVAVSLLAAREFFLSSPGSSRRTAAVLMFASTVPLFWSRLIFSLFSGVILQADALLVSAISGTERIGNAVAVHGSTGYLWIQPGCSSFANMSLAFLCWIMCTQFAGRTRTSADYVYCCLACLAVVIINVARICLVALRPDLYGLIHGPIGITTFSYLTVLVVTVICVIGVRRGAIANAEADRDDHCDMLDRLLGQLKNPTVK